MFDILGMNKTNANEAIESMMKGATRGMLEAYEYRIQEKDEEIKRKL